MLGDGELFLTAGRRNQPLSAIFATIDHARTNSRWLCVTWDGDFRFNGSGWSYHDFRGDRWSNIANADNRVFLRNAYRVLLTRARQGMVVFVPPGDASDPTRSPALYDSTFNYLRDLGIPEIA